MTRAPGARDVALFFVCVEAEGTRQRIDLSGRVLSYEYKDSEDKADRCVLTLDNFDLSFLDSDLLRKGNTMEVSWGYPANLSPARPLVIQKVKGFTTLRVEASARSVLLHKDTRCRVFEGKTRAEVAQEIAKANGFDRERQDIEDTKERLDVITQAKQTDAQFMKRLAQKEGFEFYIDFDGFHFHRRRLTQKPVRSFTYYTDRTGEVIKMDIDNDLAARFGAVRIKGRDPLKKKDTDVRATNASTKRGSLGDAIEILDRDSVRFKADATNASEQVITSPARENETKREAEGRFRKGQLGAIKMSMTARGDPALLAKTVVQIRGIGERYSGNYYVSEIVHTISGSGYTMKLKMKRDATSETGRTESKGEVNTAKAEELDPSQLKTVERFDPNTAAFDRVEFRDRSGRVVGAQDPKTGISTPVE